MKAVGSARPDFVGLPPRILFPDFPESMSDTALSGDERRALAERVSEVMHELYPEADCVLNYRSALELLVATILSAQSTDKTVNRVTESLFETYRTAEDYAGADPEALQEAIRSTGFYRNKAKYLRQAAQQILDQHGGQVPDTMEALTALPGVARKTANVVLGTYYGKNEGFVVDTHVKRVAYRLGLTDEKRPAKVEKDLMVLFQQEEWTFLGHAIIWHGRSLCDARNPQCSACPLEAECLQRGVS